MQAQTETKLLIMIAVKCKNHVVCSLVKHYYKDVKWNLTQWTKKSAILCCQSVLSAVPLCAYSYSVSWKPLPLFSLWTIHFSPSLPPFIFPLINECDRCLLPFAWGLMGGRYRFTSHGDVTLSRGCCGGLPKMEAPGHPGAPNSNKQCSC